MKPQMSAPAKEMPARPLLSTAGMDHRMSSQVDLMSPVQWLLYAPDPRKVDLRSGRQGASGAPSRGRAGLHVPTRWRAPGGGPRGGPRGSAGTCLG